MPAIRQAVRRDLPSVLIDSGSGGDRWSEARSDSPLVKSRALSVAIYARVSSEQQPQEHTIACQVAALRQRVGDDRLTLDEALCFLDDG